MPPSADLAAALDRAGVALKGRETPLCSLWAGYGRVTAVEGVRDGARLPLIIKRVTPPATAPADDDGGHARKLASYVAESAFYREVAPGLVGSRCPVAEPVAVVEQNAPDSYALALALADLRPAHPVFTKGSLRPPQLRAALTWLAEFHATFWGVAGRDDVPPLLSDREGTFWHLATRPAEYDAIPRDWSDLKAAAPAIDAALAAAAAGPHGTLVHGDAKAANFCWTEGGCKNDSVSAAAFDFQYVGRGVGARDVAYLLSSAGGAGDDEEGLLSFYLDALLAALARRGADPAGYDAGVLRSHYDLACADFVRFMAGWGWWGGGSDRAAATARRVAREVLKKGGGEDGGVRFRVEKLNTPV